MSAGAKAATKSMAKAAIGMRKSKRASDLEEGGDETAPLLPQEKRGKAVEYSGLLDGNVKFTADLGLATRGACAVVLAGMPFFLPKGTFPTIDHMVEEGLYSSAVVVYLIFTLYHTVGETIAFAWCGSLGTFLAMLNIWLLFGIFPDGVTPTSPTHVFWIAAAWGTAFVTTLLLLNVSLGTAIFGIATFVWYWMDFLDEGVDNFSKGFSISLSGSAVRGMLACLTGCGLAIIVSLVPYPRWAMNKARMNARDVARDLQGTWGEFARFFCAESANPFVESRLQSRMEGLRGQVGTLSGHVQNSWWECFGVGRWQRVRRMLLGLDATLKDTYDRLASAMSLCISDEIFGEEHHEVMGRVGPHAKLILEETSLLLQKCVEAACEGEFTDSDVSGVQLSVVRVRGVADTFSAEFQEACPPDLSEKHLVERIFCTNVYAFSRAGTEFAEELLEYRDGRRHEDEGANLVKALGGVFDPWQICEATHLGFAVRNAITILFGFWLGYYGFGHTLPKHSPAIASTATVLMSKFIGSAMQNNLTRVQGVILGTVSGQLLYALLGQCVWWNHLLLGFVVFFWALATLFMYYNSTQFAGIGCMLAIFGTMNMLNGCFLVDVPLDTKGSYQAVLNVVITIMVILVVDFILGSTRPSIKANVAYRSAWGELEAATARVFDATEQRTCSHKGDLIGAITTADALGREACLEPRYWRAPWRAEAFQTAVAAAYSLRTAISMIEYTLTEDSSDGGLKCEFVKVLLSAPGDSAFPKMAKLLQEHFAEMRNTLAVFEHESPVEFTQTKAGTLPGRDFVAETQACLQELVKAYPGSVKGSIRTKPQPQLDRDDLCRLCIVLASIQKMQESMAALRAAINRMYT